MDVTKRRVLLVSMKERVFSGWIFWKSLVPGSGKHTCISPLSPTSPSSCLSSPFPAQEEQFPFPLLFLFLPFLHNSLFTFLCILGFCGKEYAIRGQPSLWDKRVGEEPQTELAPHAVVTEASGKRCYRTGSFFFQQKILILYLSPSFCPDFSALAVPGKIIKITFVVDSEKIDLGCRK